MAEDKVEAASYSQFACVGAGISAIGLGATLKRWYGITDVRFFERHDDLGGTWHANTYPGAACDVPSALYSFSYEPKANWTRILPSGSELWEYLDKVAQKYDLRPKMSFGVKVESAEWIEETTRWRIIVRDLKTGRVFAHECQFLFAAMGLLVTPRELDVPGASTFEGAIFHSAQWQDVDLTGKRVVVFGNGCTGAQIVPSIVGQTQHLTQIVRSKHWVFPPIDKRIPKGTQTLLQYMPGLTLLSRIAVFFLAEKEFRGFYMTSSAERFRERRRRQVEKYMRETAPKKYHDVLIPEFEIGCKRRIFDVGYLESLHAENLTLTDDKAVEIVADGVRLESGAFVPADVIIHANGFETNHYLGDVKVKGRGGITPEEHWESFGGVEAYNCIAMSGFPNFFMLLGPNSATGHTSAFMASENSINYALRIIKPILDGSASVADVKPDAERKYVNKVQDALSKTVWASGCMSWYIRAKPGGKTWNASTYPWTQPYYWWRSLFPVWSDWQYSGPTKPRKGSARRKALVASSLSLVLYILWHIKVRGRHHVVADVQAATAATVTMLQTLKGRILSI